MLIPTLVGVSLICTAFARLLPGDAVDILTAETSTSGGPSEIKTLVDQQLIKAGVDPLKATFSDRNKIQQPLIEAELRKKGIDPAKRVTASAILFWRACARARADRFQCWASIRLCRARKSKIASAFACKPPTCQQRCACKKRWSCLDRFTRAA